MAHGHPDLRTASVKNTVTKHLLTLAMGSLVPRPSYADLPSEGLGTRLASGGLTHQTLNRQSLKQPANCHIFIMNKNCCLLNGHPSHRDVKYCTLFTNYRNEQFQEELWQITVDLVKTFLSPDLLEKYGPAQTTTSQPEAAGEATKSTSEGEVSGAERGGGEEGQKEQQLVEREEKSSDVPVRKKE